MKVSVLPLLLFFVAYAHAISHGSELTKNMTGWWALGVSQTDLTPTQIDGRISNYPGNQWPSWYPRNTPYVYNNDPSNKGGVVPAGGMVIDGFNVPAGTVVVQFRDFSGEQFIVEGDYGGQYGTFPGLMLRGIRWRNPSSYIGLVLDSNTGLSTGGKIWFHFCDMGGIGTSADQYCEVPIKTIFSTLQVYRNYLSVVTMGVQAVSSGTGNNILENYIEELSTFGTDVHVNGIEFNGGDLCWRIERNHIVTAQYDSSGRELTQTDDIAFFQDFGPFPGSCTNDDGAVGYRVINNYLGGTGYCIYAGWDPSKNYHVLNNFQLIGNRITTASYPNGGYYGPIASIPTWGTNGNVACDNLWADGPKAGQSWDSSGCLSTSTLASSSSVSASSSSSSSTSSASATHATSATSATHATSSTSSTSSTSATSSTHATTTTTHATTTTSTIGSPSSSSTTGSSPAQSLYTTNQASPSIETTDTQAVNLGVQFSSSVSGSVTGLMIYRASGVTIQTGTLYGSSHQVLANLTFPSGSGWIQANFAHSVVITANTVYTAAYFAPGGKYAVKDFGFNSARSVGNLQVAVEGGKFLYSSRPSFPTQSYQNSEYFISPLFVAN